MCVYTREPSEIQTPKHWNLVGRNMTAQQSVLSPSSIFPPSASHCAFFPARNKGARLKNVIVSTSFTFLNSCVSMKQLKSGEGGVCNGNVLFSLRSLHVIAFDGSSC
jgi:hypothetical protein